MQDRRGCTVCCTAHPVLAAADLACIVFGVDEHQCGWCLALSLFWPCSHSTWQSHCGPADSFRASVQRNHS